MNSDVRILEGLVSGDELNKAYKSRSAKFNYKKVVKENIQPHLDEGWEKTRRRSNKFSYLRKPKDVGASFEDDVWTIFYRMGFSEMNKDRHFKIRRYGTNLAKQIDIFARDDQCICIVECKASDKPHSKTSLGKDIDQIAAIHHEAQQSIYSHYKAQGNGNKFKIKWILALKNIDISEPDKERAEQANILVIDDSMIEYYQELSNHFGHSAKYQFLGDLFPNKDIPNLFEPLPAIRGSMGGIEFYSFVIEPEKLLKIGYLSHRARTNEESIKTYQRMANKSRLKKIAKYIQEKQGVFPTSIVLNIESKREIRFDQAEGMAGKNATLGTLYLPNKYQSAWIIDGQHRVYAYSGLEEAKTATLPVIAFVNMDPQKQAQLFVDINGEQVKVQKNHLLDLYANLHIGSDDPKQRLLALISLVSKELDTNPKSPFRDRFIKIGGRKTKKRNLTLAGISEELRKTRLIGFVHSAKAKEISPGHLYKEDETTTINHARDVICNYYNLYLNNEKLKQQWEIGSGEGGFICTNLGILTTLRILKAIIEHLATKEQISIRSLNPRSLTNYIEKYATPVVDFLSEAPPNIIRDFKRGTGESGVSSSYFSLVKEINSKYPEFKPAGFDEYLQKTDTTNNSEARTIYFERIEPLIQKDVVKTLKATFGNENSQWFNKCVKENIRKTAVNMAVEFNDLSHQYEKYLYLMDLKEIISDNWSLFQDKYTIEAKPNDSKKKRLDWFNKLNEIRNIISHPPRGGVSDEQLAYLKQIADILDKRLGID